MRLNFRDWVKLSEFQEALPQPEAIFSILGLAKLDFEKTAPWYDVVNMFHAVMAANHPKDIPLVEIREKQNKKEEDAPWNYPGRNWFMWVNLMAKSYGWSIEYIAHLDFDDALALLQELLVSDQLDYERQWAMSEIAYPYDKEAKAGKFKALPRPSFMLPKPSEAKIIKIPIKLIPAGVVLTGKENESFISDRGI